MLSDLKISIDNYNGEMSQISTKIASLSNKIWFLTGSHKMKVSRKISQLRDQRIALRNKHKTDLKHIDAYKELKKTFNGNKKDYNAFIALAVDFHNTYVHKSHSSMLGAKDYDADGNIIGTRQLVMGAETDGILTWYLHRHVYHRDYDNVIKKLCEEKNAKKRNYISVTITDYTAYRWATPKKLAI